ncbi:MAG: D-Ala-D-Ala carboxypeptidase family metallohydrolase [Mesorhizobium sp.]
MEKRKGEQDAADKEKAINDAHREDAPAWDEGVRRGLIPPQNSQTYMEWYKKTKGDVQGRKLQDKFQVAYLQWEGRNSGDPEAFNQFAQNFIKENVAKDTDPQILAGLNPHVEQILNGGYAQFTKDRTDYIVKDTLATEGAAIVDGIESAETDARANGEDVDLDQLWGGIVERRTEALKRTQETDYDAYLVDSIILQAEESGNEHLLGLLEKKLPGKDYALSSDPAVQEKRNASVDRIHAKQASMATTEAQAQEKRDKAEHEATLAKVTSILAQDPNADVPDAMIKSLERRDGEARVKIAQMRKNFSEAGVLEDPKAIAEVFADIHAGADEKRVMEFYRQGVIRDRQTLLQALDRVEKLRKSKADGGGIIDSPSANSWKKQFTNLTGTSELNPFGARGLTDEGRETLMEFDMMLLDWEERNPNATRREREEEINRAGEALRKRIMLEAGQTSGGQFQSQADLERLKAQAREEERQPSQTQPPAPNAESEPDSSSLYDTVADWVGSWFGNDDSGTAPTAQPDAAEGRTPAVTLDALPESARPAVEELAKQHGIPTDEAASIYQKNLELLRGGPAPAAKELPAEGEAPGIDPEITNSIPEEARSSLENLLHNPPREVANVGNIPVSPFLHLIGKTEGTDSGDGYNETLGYGAFTGGDVNLEGMTLDQIDALQTQILHHPDNAHNASPVGRYQIVQKTLRTLRKEMGLSGSEKFTRQLQDRMALALLERRGLSQWQAGKMSDEQFLTNLSREWASLRGANREAMRGLIDAMGGDEPALAFAPEGRSRMSPFEALVTSSKRGYEPDMEGLKPEFKEKVTGLQAAFGKELPIVSGHRGRARNAKAGGAKDSRHIHGDAVDIDVSGLSREDRIRLIQMARAHGFGGIGIYANSIHIDTGPTRAWGPSHGVASLPKWARDALA